ncbi:hypothetical protein [Flexivirga oryzae]|uniref:Uncharacterized protein n=1 Tax=Flexivirga oryzae TaxID=1794944 RepID=A0A839N523_9MICO|nr:hypothetical protein [Flexivirga oryzae]MBB2891123.1 hypothetical protein [Flexivirga oryzae]
MIRVEYVNHFRYPGWAGQITCPYCGNTHQHGVADETHGVRLGHRASHCGAQPWRNIGYVLTDPTGILDAAMRKKRSK